MELETYINYINLRFKKKLQVESNTKLTCPHCGSGYLISKRENFITVETENSKRDRKKPGWEPEWVEYSFSAILNCNNCIEKTLAIGVGSIVEEGFKNEEKFTFEEFTPKYFIPTISLFKIPDATPDSVKQPLIDSFKIAWSDLAAAGNKIRIATEYLIENIHPAASKTLTLDKKIQALPDSFDNVKNELLAIKWLGNEASHKGKLEEYDIAFSYKTFETILSQLFGTGADMKKITDSINQKKGSIAKK